MIIGLPVAAVVCGVVAVALLRDSTPGSAGSLSSDEGSPASAETTADPDPTDDAPASPTSVASTSTPPRDPDELVAEFRTVLEEHDLTSGSLSDDEIITFGTTLCVFAASADEPDDFQALKDLAIEDTESELSDVELSVAISAAIIVFCPLDAERLDVTL